MGCGHYSCDSILGAKGEKIRAAWIDRHTDHLDHSDKILCIGNDVKASAM